MSIARLAWVGLALLSAAQSGSSEPSGLPVADVERAEPISFQIDILPVLRESCLACHNQTRSKADLVLESPQAMRQGGASGPALVDGKPEESLVFLVAAHREEGLEMPPPGNASAAKDLTPHELGLLKLWIEQGAPGEGKAFEEPDWEPLPPSFRPIYSVAMDPDGRFLACGRGNQVWLYEAPTRRFLTRLTDPRLIEEGLYAQPGVAQRDLASSMAFSPDGQWLATGDYRSVHLWRREGPKQHSAWGREDPTPVEVINQNARGALAWAHESGGVFMGFPDQEKVVAAEGTGGSVVALSWSDDGRWLLALEEAGALRVVEPDTGRLAYRDSNANAAFASWVGDEGLVTLDSSGGVGQVFEDGSSFSKRSALGPLETDSKVAAVLPMPDGGLLAVDGAGVGWRMDSGGQTWEKGFQWDKKVFKVQWLELGKRLLVVEPTGASSIWDWSQEQWLDSLDNAAPAERLRSLWDRESRFLDAEAERLRERMESIASDRVTALGRWGTSVAARREAETAWKEGLEASQVAEVAWVEARTRRDTLASEKDRLTAALEEAWERQKILEAERESYSEWAQTEAGRAKIAASVSDLTEVSLERGALEGELQKAQAAWNQVKGNIEKEVADLEKKWNEAREATVDLERGFAIASEEWRLATLAKDRFDRDLDQAQVAYERGLVQASTMADQRAAAPNPAELRRRARLLGGAVGAEGVPWLAAPLGVRTIGLFSAQTGEFLEAIETSGPIRSWTMGGMGSLHVGLESGEVLSWDVVPRWRWVRDLGGENGTAPFEDRVSALAFSADGSRLAVGSGSPSRTGTITVFDTSRWRPLAHDPSAHSDVVLTLAFSNSGEHLASGGADRFVRVWRSRDLAAERTFEGHTGYVLSLNWARDQRRLVSTAADGRALIWDRESGVRTTSFEISGKEGVYVGFRNEGTRVIGVGSAPSTRVFDLEGQAQTRYEGARDYLSAAAQDRQGRRLIAGGYKGTLWLWEGDRETPVEAFSLD